MIALVGDTGFVGSNIAEQGTIDFFYNSRNIKAAYGTKPDLLIYAGMRAEKHMANLYPERDMQAVLEAENNIVRIAPKKLVLISTIDVYENPAGADEDSRICVEKLAPYGANRYQLECRVRERYREALIIRLPGLFGRNLKKNFIYDYMNYIPTKIKAEKMSDLIRLHSDLADYYMSQEDGFYQCRALEPEERTVLKGIFAEVGFSALSFTDSRSIYQFYPLNRIWKDILIGLREKIDLWNPATEPITAGELYQYLTGREFTNVLPGVPAHYDYRTKYAELFGGSNGYIMNKQEVLKSIAAFVGENQK